jgi:uncharacterized membrane protein YfcA
MSVGGVVQAAARFRRGRERHRAAMWAAISVAAGGLLGVVALGLDAELLGVVAGGLLLSCLAICVWAGISEARAAKQVEAAVAEVARRRVAGRWPRDRGNSMRVVTPPDRAHPLTTLETERSDER